MDTLLVDKAMNDTQRYFITEFAWDYREGRMSRRELLRRTLLITGSAAATATALLALGCGSRSQPAAAPSASSAPAIGASPSAGVSPASATPGGTLGASTMPPPAQTTDFVVQPDDPAITARNVQFPGQAGTIFGYLAQPKASSAAPGLILIPENMGLVEPNMDIARRYAKEGYVTLAVDLVSRAGGTAKYANDPAQIPAILGRMNAADLVADLQSALAYLKTIDGVRKDRLGVTGFCFGGNQTFALATASPEILAAVPFYGMAKLDDLSKSKAAFLCFYGALDNFVTPQAQQVQQTLQQLGRPVEIHIEPNAMHAFFRNSGASYNPAAARDAWPRTLAWFQQYLKT
jgi:carboxymethylenebutenolidase